MANRSSNLAWRIPWTEEPGRIQSLGSQRVGHDWNDLARTNANTASQFRLWHLAGSCWTTMQVPLTPKCVPFHVVLEEAKPTTLHMSFLFTYCPLCDPGPTLPLVTVALSQSFLCFWRSSDWRRTWQVFCRMSVPTGMCLRLFSRLDWVIAFILEGRLQRHHILSRAYMTYRSSSGDSDSLCGWGLSSWVS